MIAVDVERPGMDITFDPALREYRLTFHGQSESSYIKVEHLIEMNMTLDQYLDWLLGHMDRVAKKR